MSCRFCSKQFNRGFNLRRHEKEYCSVRNKEINMSDLESQKSDDSTSTADSDSSMVTVDESQTEDPWTSLVEEAKERNYAAFEEMKTNLIDKGLDEQSASDQANSNILPELQKELESIYMERLSWMKQLKKDPVHRKIMKTKNTLVEDDDFDPEEALEAAVDKRKFLIRRLLKDYRFDEENDDVENDD